MASVATAGYRQSASLDLSQGGFSFAKYWLLEAAIDLQATPTKGNPINFFASWGAATGAGWGNTSGSDAAYTGISAAVDSVKLLEFLGALVLGVSASGVQKGIVGIIRPKNKWLNLVVDNESGATYAASDTNCVVTLTPLVDDLEG